MKKVFAFLILTSVLDMFAQGHYSVSDIFIKDNIAYALADSLPLNGKVISKYNNGKLEYERQYKNGLPDGTFKAWIKDGKLKYKTNFNNGTGTERFYHYSGKLKEEIKYKDGKRDGPYMYWWPHRDQLKIEGNYANGLKEGSWRSWGGLGNPRTEFKYKNGKPVFHKKWGGTGRMISLYNDSLLRKWDSKGNLTHEEHYKDEVKTFRKYCSIEGILLYEKPYRNGLADGFEKRWWGEDQLKYEKGYKNGKEHGPHREWSSKGVLIKESNYKNGIPDGRFFECHTGWQHKPKKEDYFKYGIKDSISRKWYYFGDLEYEVSYKDGKPDGLCRTWYMNGHKEYERMYDRGKLIHEIYYQRNGTANQANSGYQELWNLIDLDHISQFETNEDIIIDTLLLSAKDGTKESFPMIRSKSGVNDSVVAMINNYILGYNGNIDINKDSITTSYNDGSYESGYQFHYEVKYNFLSLDISYYYSSMSGEGRALENYTVNLNTGNSVHFSNNVSMISIFTLSGYFEFLEKYWLPKAKKEVGYVAWCVADGRGDLKAVEELSITDSCFIPYADCNCYSFNGKVWGGVSLIMDGCVSRAARCCEADYSIGVAPDSLLPYLNDFGKNILIEDDHSELKGLDKELYLASVKKSDLPENYYYVGIIDDKYPFKMALSIEGDSVTGYYYYDKTKEKISLNGSSYYYPKRFKLTESSDGNVTGYFYIDTEKCSWNELKLVGDWSNADSSKTLDVKLYNINSEY